MINYFFYIQKLKLLTPCYKFSSIPTPTKSLLSLFAGEFFFLLRTDVDCFTVPYFPPGGGGGRGITPLLHGLYGNVPLDGVWFL